MGKFLPEFFGEVNCLVDGQSAVGCTADPGRIIHIFYRAGIWLQFSVVVQMRHLFKQKALIMDTWKRTR